MGCPFCDRENIGRQIIFESEMSFAIPNIRPANRGQCLVIPKRHVANIRELSDTEAEDLFRTVKRVSEVLNRHLVPDGFNYGFNEGAVSGQTVEHMHFHIMPRFEGDNLPEHHLFHRKEKKNISEKELLGIAAELRELF